MINWFGFTYFSGVGGLLFGRGGGEYYHFGPINYNQLMLKMVEIYMYPIPKRCKCTLRSNPSKVTAN